MTKIISPTPAKAKEAAVPADMLSREEIAFLRDLSIANTYPVMQRALDAAEAYLGEPTRLASAHAEGVREGIEVALADIAAFDGDLNTSSRMNPDYMAARVMRAAAEILTERIRALSPPPAEPSAPTAEYRARIAALVAENAALRRELEPLAREAERYDPPAGDGTENLSEAWDSRFTIGHLRRARALLQGGPDAG